MLDSIIFLLIFQIFFVVFQKKAIRIHVIEYIIQRSACTTIVPKISYIHEQLTILSYFVINRIITTNFELISWIFVFSVHIFGKCFIYLLRNHFFQYPAKLLGSKTRWILFYFQESSVWIAVILSKRGRKREKMI